MVKTWLLNNNAVITILVRPDCLGAQSFDGWPTDFGSFLPVTFDNK